MDTGSGCGSGSWGSAMTGIGGAAAAGGGGDVVGADPNIWLCVGVLCWGVISMGPSSSSDESSSPRPSISSWSCLSRSLAASISARWAASLASFSLASRSAACLRRFSSCFLTFPCLTCSSRALRRACAASLSLARSSSCCLASALQFIVSIRFAEVLHKFQNLL